MSDIQLYRYSTSISCNMQDAALACQDFLPGFVDGHEADARLAVAFQRAAVSGARSGLCVPEQSPHPPRTVHASKSEAS